MSFMNGSKNITAKMQFAAEFLPENLIWDKANIKNNAFTILGFALGKWLK